MSNFIEIAFYGLSISFVCAINLAYLLKRNYEKPKTAEKVKIRSSESLMSFEQFQKIESGECSLRQVYSNDECPHCGSFIDLSPKKARYFAFDRNICGKCFSSMMKKARY